EDDRESIVINNPKNKDCLEINKKFLVKTLRKPSLYSNSIEIASNSYALSIPLVEINELPKDLQYYIKWGMLSGSAKPAINAYGAYWYSHTYKQIRSKKPFGHVFIPDKVDLSFKQRGVFANYSKENISASKNFYIIKDHDGITSKIITGWFNSTIFISILVLLGRRISDTWTRFLENDYLELPLINVNSIENYCAMQIVQNIDNIIQKPLPPLWDQLYDKYRYKLDTSILNAIKIKNPESILHELYNILSYGFESHYKCL
ncbi:MAG: restriction endonuclease subunit M, partial [Candidatus Odinarchaeota archaeon]|nr:restriction endonuclease subunit M [Candidatus Odinarchaeota archaeon]